MLIWIPWGGDGTRSDHQCVLPFRVLSLSAAGSRRCDGRAAAARGSPAKTPGKLGRPPMPRSKASGAGDVPAIRIERENEWAWCGKRRLALTPKAFAVLRHLVEHAGRLITKDELMTTVWRDAIVSDSALISCIRDLRRALSDSPAVPRYIETVHRRGFRFIGPATATAPVDEPAPIPAPSTPSTLVGRDAELGRLHELLKRAMSGKRQLAFVTGEPGIGKTAVVETLLAQIDSVKAFRVGRGQCVEQYGAGEAYLPVLEALGRLGREPGGDHIVQVLKQYAPTWLVQLPALVADEDLAAVERRAAGATRERMLREIVEALEALTVDGSLVLVLEDLHWSDSATIDFLAMLARRREPARVLVLGTYRPADLVEHPLKAVKRELELHSLCEEIALSFLGIEAVTEYLARRFNQRDWPATFARMLHGRTDGNALFLVNTVDELLRQDQLREVHGRWSLVVPLPNVVMETPETLWHMVDKQIERLTPDEQEVLALASVAGREFSAASAIPELMGPNNAEALCDGLARRGQFLRAAGVAEWPDGTVAGRYAFIHALYQEVLYARIPVAHRIAAHLRTGERLERGHGRRASEIAGELAMHFEHGRDLVRAARYHGQAGETALRQHGYREAVGHVTQALEMLRTQPDSEERRQQELTLQLMLGSALTPYKGHAAADVERAYARARELCDQVRDSPRLLPVVLGLAWFYLVRGSLPAARDLGRRLRTMAETSQDATTLVAAHHTLGLVAMYAGELRDAIAHLERGIEAHDETASAGARTPAPRLTVDPVMSCLLHAASVLWDLGYPEQSAQRMHQAMAEAQRLDHPFSLAHAHRFAAAFHASRRERDAALEHADAAIAISTEHGFTVPLMGARFCRGWALVDQGCEEGLALMQAGAAAVREIRAGLLIPSTVGWLAEACAKLGRHDEALALIDEARSEERRVGEEGSA